MEVLIESFAQMTDELREQIILCQPPIQGAVVVRTTRYLRTGGDVIGSFVIRTVQQERNQDEDDEDLDEAADMHELIPTMSRTDMCYCRNVFGIEIPALDREYRVGMNGLQIDWGVPAGRVLPDMNYAANIGNYIVSQRHLEFLNANNNLRLPVVIGLLMLQNDFVDYYEDYMLDPDDGIEFEQIPEGDDAVNAALQELGLAGADRPVNDHLTENEGRILFGLLVLSLHKTISGNVQHENFVKSRVSAMRANLHAVEFHDAEFALNTFSLESIKAISSTLCMYPKLKMAILMLVLREDRTITIHLRPFLPGTQLTIFAMIHDFLTHEVLTYAHTCSAVVNQANAWFEVYTGLVQTYGNHWRYFKLFEPNNVSTAQTKWPVLACAAWMHSMIIQGKQSMINVMASRTSMAFLKPKIARRIPEQFIDRQQRADEVGVMREELRRFVGLRENYADAAGLEQEQEQLDEGALAAADAMIAQINMRMNDARN
uniref:Uncharacterized protein n=1 Tax=Cacopsylla melanoneura TaxID=428564 RepID=A0A8D9BVA0_9HEMI